MRDTRSILNKNNGEGQSGYTMKIHSYSGISPYYTGAALYTYTDNGDGTYHVDVTATIKGTIVITTAAGTTIVPSNFIGRVFWGDNIPTIPPT